MSQTTKRMPILTIESAAVATLLADAAQAVALGRLDGDDGAGMLAARACDVARREAIAAMKADQPMNDDEGKAIVVMKFLCDAQSAFWDIRSEAR